MNIKRRWEELENLLKGRTDMPRVSAVLGIPNSRNTSQRKLLILGSDEVPFYIRFT